MFPDQHESVQELTPVSKRTTVSALIVPGVITPIEVMVQVDIRDRELYLEFSLGFGFRWELCGL